MALTDLTGTTWTLNDTLTSYAGGSYSLKTYSVNITTDTALPTYDGDADTFVMLTVGYDSGGEHNIVWLYTTSTASWDNRADPATGEDTKTLPDTWVSRYEGTFTITGGTDATNSTLIAWMEDNCTQYVPPTPDVVVTYEGSNIVELSEAGTKTLKTAGKYLTDDVVLAYSGGSGGGGVETASVVVCKASGNGYGSVYYTDENMEPQNAYGIVRASMPIGSIVVANDSTPAEPGPTAQRTGITQLFAYPSRSSVIYAFKVTG